MSVVTLAPCSTKDILSSLSRLSDDPSYHDCSLVCSDGVVRWNRFLVSANSHFLSACLSDTSDVEGDSSIILPDVSSATLGTLLKCTLNYAVRRDILSVNEQQVMTLLGFSLLKEHNQPNDRSFLGRKVPSPVIAPLVPSLSTSISASSPSQPRISRLAAPGPPANDEDASSDSSVFSDIPILTQDFNRDVDSISMMSMDARNDECNFPLFDKDVTLENEEEEEEEREESQSAVFVEVVKESVENPEVTSVTETNVELLPSPPSQEASPSPPKRKRKSNFTCPECGKCFVRSLHLEAHLSNHSRRRDEAFVCDLCGKIFYHESLLRSHQRYHEELEGESKKCQDCDKSFRGKRAMANHVRLAHDFVRCVRCGAEDIPKVRLRRHLEKVHGVKLRRKTTAKPGGGVGEEIHCHVCRRQFDSARSLMVHKRTHDRIGGGRLLEPEDGGFVRCKVCRKLFACREHLDIHMEKQQHVEVECDVCGKSVRDLAKHTRNVHSPGGLNSRSRTVCVDPECGKEFATKYAAKYHYLRSHGSLLSASLLQNGGGFKAKCGICDKEYLNLKRHEREVHAENRFECKTCGNFFPVLQSLERHIRNVHHPTRVACPYCEKEVLHLSGHLSGAHGMPDQCARDMAEGLTGKSSARTDLQYAFAHKITGEK